jgi:hypothetical protein
MFAVIVIIWLQTNINCRHLSSCSGICPCVFCGCLFCKAWMGIVLTSLIVGYIATRGSAVGWGNALQVGRSRVRFQFAFSSGSGRLLPLCSATSLTYTSGDLCTYCLLNINNAGCLHRHARWVKDETHCYVASSRPALDWLPLIFTSGFTRN